MNTKKLKTKLTILLVGMMVFLTPQRLIAQSAAVFGVYVNEVDISPEMAADILRIEMSKINKYQVLDKLDLLEVEEKSQLKFIDCYGRTCLQTVGKEADVDFAVAGAIESLGPKLVITLKVFDVNQGKYAKVNSMEFYNNLDEIQRMVRIVIRDAYELENQREMVEMLTFYEQPPSTQRSKLKNDGPRFGLSYIGGDAGDIFQLPENEGGYDAFPLMSQFGYQVEKAYISSGDFEALLEGLFLVTGIEQNVFIPNLAILNGFRSTKSGLEFGFGPSLSARKTATGYDDSTGVFTLGYPPIGSEAERYTRIDSRGSAKFSATWVWAVGKTFRSGYLNIPVNGYFSHGKNGWTVGLSMGFNIAR